MEEYPDLKIGDRVIRGPDWEWRDQDGFEENTDPLKYKGTVTEALYDNSWFRVKWDYNFLDYVYRYNNEEHDIILCDKLKHINNDLINYNPKPFFNFNFDLIAI